MLVISASFLCSCYCTMRVVTFAVTESVNDNMSLLNALYVFVSQIWDSIGTFLSLRSSVEQLRNIYLAAVS